MKNIKNNKTILAVIPAVVVLAAGVAFFCSRSGNTDKQCQETVERLQKLETADISSIEDEIRALSEKEKPTGSDSEEGVLGDILTDVQIKQAFQGTHRKMVIKMPKEKREKYAKNNINTQ